MAVIIHKYSYILWKEKYQTIFNGTKSDCSIELGMYYIFIVKNNKINKQKKKNPKNYIFSFY